MDSGLSLIMTNHAKVKKNDFVFDPFVGTGEKLPLYVPTRARKCVSKYFHIFGSVFQGVCW